MAKKVSKGKEEKEEKVHKEQSVQKVYSPDITPYSFEGDSYFLGTFLSIFVAPIRVVSRVMHNIFVLPANFKEEYANALMLTSGILFVLGLYGIYTTTKWALALSQVPAFLYAVRLRRQAQLSTELARKRRHVEIDTEQVKQMCESVYDELEGILGGEDNEETEEAPNVCL